MSQTEPVFQRPPGPRANLHLPGLASMLARNALIYANRPALSDPGGTLTYRQLLDRVSETATAFGQGGLQQGESVAILMDNRSEWLVHFLAVLVAGGVAVPLSFYNTAAETGAQLRDADARWVITECRYASLVHDAGTDSRVTVIDDPSGKETAHRKPRANANGSADAFAAPASRTESRDPDTAALIQYTSGTLGRPKAIVHSHATMMWNALHQIGDLDIDASTTTLVVPSLAWGAGLHDLTIPTLWAGGHVVLYQSRALQGQLLLRTLADVRATHVFLAPSVLGRLANVGGAVGDDLEALRVVLTGGEPVPSGLLDLVDHVIGPLPIWPSYGLSEFPSTMTLMTPDQARNHPHSVGRATSIADIDIVDEAGRAVPFGTVGELVCRSPATMLGYRNDPAATATALKDGWLHTDDLATMDEDGYVTIVGRKKDMLISGGLNVYLAEVEQALLEHRGIAEAAVVPASDERWGEVPCAHVVLMAGQTLTEAELAAFLSVRLASYKRPKQFVFHESPLPRNAAGKVIKAALLPAIHAYGH